MLRDVKYVCYGSFDFDRPWANGLVTDITMSTTCKRLGTVLVFVIVLQINLLATCSYTLNAHLRGNGTLSMKS
jgi:hypothetical protein